MQQPVLLLSADVYSSDDVIAIEGLHVFSLGEAGSSFFNEETNSSNRHFTPIGFFPTDAPIESVPILNANESVIYTTSVDGIMRALATNLQNLQNGTDIWSFGPKQMKRTLEFPENNPGMQFTVGSHFIHSNPVLSPAGDKIYFVGYSSFLVCLDASDGQLIWISSKFTDLGTLNTFASPILSEAGDLVYLGTDKGFGAYNASTGAVVWKETFSKSFQTYRIMTAAVYTSKATNDAVVFFGRDDWYLYAYNAYSGERVGRFKADDRIRSTPVVHPSEPVLFVGGNDRQFRSVRFNATSKMLDTSALEAPSGLGIFPGNSELDVEYEWTILTNGELLTTPVIR